MFLPLQLHPHSVVTYLLHSSPHSCPVLDTSGACQSLSEHNVETPLRGMSESLFLFMAVQYSFAWADCSACPFLLGRIPGCLHLLALQLPMGFFLAFHGRVPEVELLGRAVTGRCLLEVLWTAAVCPGSLVQGRSSPATPSSSCSLWNPCLTSELERKPTVVAHACHLAQESPRQEHGGAQDQPRLSSKTLSQK